jgi:hypothetical protein
MPARVCSTPRCAVYGTRDTLRDGEPRSPSDSRGNHTPGYVPGKRGLYRAARSCGAPGTSDAGAPRDCPLSSPRAGVSIRELQAWRPKPQAQGVGPQRAPEPSSFLSKKLHTLVSRLPVEYSGKELGRECGLQLGKDLGMEPDSLLGKEPVKELWSLLAR